MLLGIVLCRAADAPYLAVENSNGLTVVTWTNLPEIFVEESLDATTWTRSTRPFTYFGGRSRFRIAGPRPHEFFRTALSNSVPPQPQKDEELGRRYIGWPFAGTDVWVESRASLNASSSWQLATNTVRVWGGYKQLVFDNGGSAPVCFRLSRPLNHVLIVGQSLAIGGGGAPPLSTEQPYQNKMFIGQQFDPGQGPPPEDISALVPLIETTNASSSCGETIASGFANSVSFRTGPSVHDLLVSNAGRGAAGYNALKRGTDPYTRGTNHIAAARGLCQDLGYRFRAVFAVHGEGDSINQQYDADIREWQRDIEADARQMLESSDPLPMFHTQISGWGNLNSFAALSPFLLLSEHEAEPLKTVLVGPKYFLPYLDGLHLTAASYRWLGEYYAKAYVQHVVNGVPWSPLRPIAVERTNEVITLTFTGAVGGLVLDTNIVRDPRGEYPVFGAHALYPAQLSWFVTRVTFDADTDRITIPGHTLQIADALSFSANGLPPGFPTFGYVRAIFGDEVELAESRGGAKINFSAPTGDTYIFTPMRHRVGPYGFEYLDDDATGLPRRLRTTIRSVELVGTNQVRITLSNIPTGNMKRIKYAAIALSAADGGFGGPELGPRGCMRDSDPTPSLYGNTLYNWCVHFDKAVP
jgi:hypothetical protein